MPDKIGIPSCEKDHSHELESKEINLFLFVFIELIMMEHAASALQELYRDNGKRRFV